MNTSTVIFTVVPSPVASNPQRATVLVSPRLFSTDTGPTLGSFDFGSSTVPWPQRVDQIGANDGIGVRFTPGGRLYLVRLAPPARPVEARDVALWNVLFPADRRVIPYAFQEQRTRTLRAFPAALTAGYLLDTYRQAAISSPTRYLPVGVRQNADGQVIGVNPLDELIRQVHEEVDMVDRLAFQPNEDYIAGDQEDIPLALYKALRFYRRRPRINRLERPPAPPAPPDFDFHRQVALLADHPTLMRKLGLAFDIELPPLPAATSGTIELVFAWRQGGGMDVYPRTHYVVSGGKMQLAAQRPELQSGGYVRLDRPDLFPILQVDVDSAVLKTADFAVSLRRQLTDPDQPPITEASLPALRSGGLTITQNGRADRIVEQWTRQADANGRIGGISPDLWADDLTRGYRIDVEVDGQWRSLCRRYGTITVAGRTVTIDEAQEEEGYVKAASAAGGDYDPNELYLHEAIAGWSGYSLCARPPGRAIDYDETQPIGRRDRIIDGRNRRGPYLDIQAEYQARRASLPRLRFGKSYRMRARVADVAGGGLPWNDNNTSAASPPVVYGRFEPVSSPLVVQRTPITEAESLEHMVIRSKPGLSPAQYAALPTSVAAGYAADNQRHVLPPKASLELVERHGLLDAALASREQARALFNLAQREAGGIAERVRFNLDNGPTGFVPNLQLRNPPSGPPGPASNWPTTRGAPFQAGQYVLHTGDSIELNYLPDPMATGVAVWDAQAGADDIGPALIKVPFPLGAGSFSWARKQSLRVVLRGSTDGRVHRDEAVGRVIGIALPPGRKLTLRFASILDESRLTHMAIWNLLSASEQGNAYPFVRDGKFWMLTPARELTLVHAVQQPVTAASFPSGITLQRDLGGTTARLLGTVQCHSHSTSHLDVRATWKEVLDLVHEPRPRLEDRHGEAFRLAVTYGQDSVATTLVTTTVKRTPMEWNGHRYLRLSPRTESRLGTHELGDTKHRFVDYAPVATTRYQEYFPPALIADRANLETPGVPTIACNLLGTVAPEPPRVAQVIPTFRWTTEADGSSKRRGGVRVYLERPWFSSGSGERLAVIVPRFPVDVLPAERAHVSQWGRDPAWTRPSPAALSVNAFEYLGEAVNQFGTPLPVPRIQLAPNVQLPGTSFIDHAVLVVPEYSEERGLWFCDIDFAPTGAYWPFLSLALARFQPDALPGAQMSTIVRAEFVQIAPDRVANVTVNGSYLSVRVSGVSAGNSFEAVGTTSPNPPASSVARMLWSSLPSHSGKPGGGHRVRARVEARRPFDGDLGWVTVGAPVELTGNQNGDPANHLVDWIGTLPRPVMEPGMEYRVVVTESEMYATDPPGSPVFMGRDLGSSFSRYADGGERVVYIDVKSIV